ncbi:hypothetical protein OF83DRAFT_1058384 [Amylostereum chailletii]|nr:hypothetical protein OF83DRAFT_1058384 [Amylostereum chailletii]
MSSFFSNAGRSVSNAGSSLGDGLAAVGKGVSDVGNGVGKGVGQGAAFVGQGVTDVGTNVGKGVGKGVSSVGQGLGSAGQGLGQGVGDIGKGVVDAGGSVVQGGTTFVGAGVSNGFQLAANLSKDAFDLQRNVVASVGCVAGTAVDGVVTAVSMTTGAVFDPIANSLKAIEGLEGLGEGLDTINGLSIQALQQVAAATKKGLALAGQPPTLFDPDADGIVNFADTQRGFTLLGLEEKYAKIAAYALHTTFSYSTSDSWFSIPDRNTLPIKISNLPKTRWGKNWGNYERVDWVSDTDVETFFGLRERVTWTEYWTDINSKSYFGTALLIFEWGTTWPFMFPELQRFDMASPIVGQVGAIMRSVILPTIAKSHEHAREVAGEEPNVIKPPTLPNKDEKASTASAT